MQIRALQILRIEPRFELFSRQGLWFSNDIVSSVPGSSSSSLVSHHLSSTIKFRGTKVGRYCLVATMDVDVSCPLHNWTNCSKTPALIRNHYFSINFTPWSFGSNQVVMFLASGFCGFCVKFLLPGLATLPYKSTKPILLKDVLWWWL